MNEFSRRKLLLSACAGTGFATFFPKKVYAQYHVNRCRFNACVPINNHWNSINSVIAFQQRMTMDFLHSPYFKRDLINRIAADIFNNGYVYSGFNPNLDIAMAQSYAELIVTHMQLKLVEGLRGATDRGNSILMDGLGRWFNGRIASISFRELNPWGVIYNHRVCLYHFKEIAKDKLDIEDACGILDIYDASLAAFHYRMQRLFETGRIPDIEDMPIKVKSENWSGNNPFSHLGLSVASTIKTPSGAKVKISDTVQVQENTQKRNVSMTRPTDEGISEISLA